MRSTVSSLEDKWKDRVTFVYIDAGNAEEKALMDKMGETGVTVLRFFNKKGEMVKRIQGVTPAETVETELNKIVK